MFVIEGIHILPLIIGVIGILYSIAALFVIVTYKFSSEIRTKVDDGLSDGKYPMIRFVLNHQKLHLVMTFIFFMLVIFKPIKYTNVSDGERTAVRHSFDSKTYQTEREFTSVRDTSGDLKDKQDDSVEQWNHARK